MELSNYLSVKSQTVKWTNLVGERQLPFKVWLDRQCSSRQSILASNTIINHVHEQLFLNVCLKKLSRFSCLFTPWNRNYWSV